MVCIYCGFDTKVTNSRHQKRANHTWRRRACLNCKAVFSTIEAPDTAQAYSIRRTMKIEPFSKEQLLISVYDSLRHRPAAAMDAAALMNTIMGELAPHFSASVIERDVLVEVVSTVLERFDGAAATHYRAFHPVTA